MGWRRALCLVLLGGLLFLLFSAPSFLRRFEPFACLKDVLIDGPVIQEPSGSVSGSLIQEPSVGPSSTQPVVSRLEVSEPKEACPPHLLIDDLKVTPTSTFMFFADNGGHNGAQFGNQLFTGGWSIMTALKHGWPVVVVPRQPWELRKQVHQLPCLRSTRGVEEALTKLCGRCRKPPHLWRDRNESCMERGRGCRQFLMDKGIMKNPAGGAYWQNLQEWPSLNVTAREVLEGIFRPPVPKLDPPVDLPGANDLVMHFRTYGLLIDGLHRLQFAPFAFWKWTLEHHKKRVGETGRVWLVTEPSSRTHPTVLKLKNELGVQVFTGMDAMGKDAWLGDYFWLTRASSIALSFSTFSWWAGYLGKASSIYMLVPPMKVPADSWCKILPKGDPRYVFYDFYSAESFTDGEQATQRCKDFLTCKSTNNTCPSQGQNLLDLLHRYYPEMIANLGENSASYQVMKQIPGRDRNR